MSRAMDYDSFVKSLKGVATFIIGSHYNPDGDGIGSTIALGIALERMGKKVTMYSRDGVPFNLKFLPNSERIVDKIDSEAPYDIAIMVDCAQRSRISDEFAALKKVGTFVCVDHHDLDGVEADVSLIDKDAASTGEVVLHILEHARTDICADVAECIYTTLVVDTGFFKYSNTGAHVLKVAGQLVDAGARPWEVAKHLDESNPAEGMKLLAMSLATLEVSLGGRYSTMEITLDMLKKSGARMEHSEEFATYPRAIKGVEVSALFREVEESAIKVSMRSKDFVDVAKIAKGFGGGGHPHAAGFKMRCTLDQAKDKVCDAVKQLVED